MAKLRFITGTMGSAKSLDLIRARYNYIERGLNPIVLKPYIDTREGTDKCIIKSRVGTECEANWIYEYTDIYEIIKTKNIFEKIDIVFVDEVQFCTKEQILQLSDIVTELNIPVMAYGLKSNFKGELFSSISTLVCYADEIKEIRSICHCGRKANFNVRVINGKVVKEGNEFQIGGNEVYVPLCTKCFKENKLK